MLFVIENKTEFQGENGKQIGLKLETTVENDPVDDSSTRAFRFYFFKGHGYILEASLPNDTRSTIKPRETGSLWDQKARENSLTKAQRATSPQPSHFI